MGEAVLYTSDDCPACASARKHLKAKGVKFRKKKVEEMSRKEIAEKGIKSVPTLDKDGKRAVGYSWEKYEKVLDEND